MRGKRSASASFLAGVPGAGRAGFRNAIALDQFAASHIGAQKQFTGLGLARASSALEPLPWSCLGRAASLVDTPPRLSRVGKAGASLPAAADIPAMPGSWL